ncbi:zinc finger CCHC domain-containing protein 7-like [Ornithodoros turicata]|uniref:zinc finger CCHC domain-containing protein 7-like n=1 Tax=Ornithodoros turicata TaxID=34597 RepID=UPI003138A5F6
MIHAFDKEKVNFTKSDTCSQRVHQTQQRGHRVLSTVHYVNSVVAEFCDVRTYVSSSTMYPSDEDCYLEGVDSDEPDSEVEALLYSKIHYAEGIDDDVDDQRNEATTVPESSPEKSAEDLKLATCSDDEEVVVLDEIYSDYQTSTSDSDPDSETVVISSDDDDIMTFGDSDPDITINADGAPGTRTGLKHEDLWRIDADDKYRNLQGFRYHNMPNFHCKSCGKMGHLSKNCPQPKERVCYLCAIPGHRGSRCPSRMCTRCFSQGHVDYECNQPYVEHCNVCNLTGHPSRLCPDFWRRYHLTVSLNEPQTRSTS